MTAPVALELERAVLQLPGWALAALPLAIGSVYYLLSAIYCLFFHPLSKYPGPKFAAISYIWQAVGMVSGSYAYRMKAVHDKYGPVVRTGPNQLSYASASSWKDIYGHVGGRKQFLKSNMYDIDEHPSLVSMRNPIQHGQARRVLSHAFSAKALSEQESLVQQYVDLLIKQIDKHATKPEGDEMTHWYNYTTFDVIGDLTFGEPFGSLQNGSYHFWIRTIFNNVFSTTVLQAAGKFDWLRDYRRTFLPKRWIGARLRHIEYSREKVSKRMNTQTTRADFMTRILEQKEAQKMSFPEMQMHCAVLVVAGSETTATCLSATTYYLCKSPEKYQKLADEVRGAFKSYEDIDGHATDRLPYLRAVIDEGLRMYPPTPGGMQRLSPGETIDGEYIPAGVEVSTHMYSATHSEKNFHRPYEFIPERWIDPNCQDRKEASNPFLLGSRVCIGRNLALLEMRLILAKIFWTYDFELMDDKLDWERDSKTYVLWNKPNLAVKFTRRPGVSIPLLAN